MGTCGKERGGEGRRGEGRGEGRREGRGKEEGGRKVINYIYGW